MATHDMDKFLAQLLLKSYCYSATTLEPTFYQHSTSYSLLLYRLFAYAKTLKQICFAVTVKLISVFVFAT